MDKKPFKSSQKTGGNKKSGMKNLGFIVILLIFGLVIFGAVGQQDPKLKNTPFSEVITRANKGEIKTIVIKGNALEVTPKGEDKATEKSTKKLVAVSTSRV